MYCQIFTSLFVYILFLWVKTSLFFEVGSNASEKYYNPGGGDNLFFRNLVPSSKTTYLSHVKVPQSEDKHTVFNVLILTSLWCGNTAADRTRSN